MQIECSICREYRAMDHFAVCVRTTDKVSDAARSYKPLLGRKQWTCWWPFDSFAAAEAFCRDTEIKPSPLDASRAPSVLVPYSTRIPTPLARFAMEAAVSKAEGTLTRYAEMGQPSLR